MKFEVNGKILNDILKKVKPYINQKSKLPALRTIKFYAEQNNIYLAATNLDIYITVTLPGAVIYEEGEFCVIFKDFQALTKGYKEQLFITDNYIQTSENELSINFESFTTEEFPYFRVAENYQEYNVSNNFITALTQCLPYVKNSKDITDDFQSVWIDQENYIASDRYSLIIIKNNEIKYENDIKLSCNIAECITKIFNNSNNLNVKIANSLMQISDDIFNVVFRITTDRKMYKYKILLFDSQNTIQFDTKYFKNIIDKLPIEIIKIADFKGGKEKEVKRTEVKINCNGKVTLATNTVNEFELDCKQYVKSEDEILLNNEYLKRLINTFKNSNEIKFEFSAGSPIMIKQDDIIGLIPRLNY